MELRLIEIEGWNASSDGWFGPCPYAVGSPEAAAWNEGYLEAVKSRLECGFDAVLPPRPTQKKGG